MNSTILVDTSEEKVSIVHHLDTDCFYLVKIDFSNGEVKTVTSLSKQEAVKAAHFILERTH